MEMLSRSSSEAVELSVALNGRDGKTGVLARNTCRKECVKQVLTRSALHERTTFHTGRITVARPSSEAANADWFLISIAHGASNNGTRLVRCRKHASSWPKGTECLP